MVAISCTTVLYCTVSIVHISISFTLTFTDMKTPFFLSVFKNELRTHVGNRFREVVSTCIMESCTTDGYRPYMCTECQHLPKYNKSKQNRDLVVSVPNNLKSWEPQKRLYVISFEKARETRRTKSKSSNISTSFSLSAFKITPGIAGGHTHGTSETTVDRVTRGLAENLEVTWYVGPKSNEIHEPVLYSRVYECTLNNVPVYIPPDGKVKYKQAKKEKWYSKWRLSKLKTCEMSTNELFPTLAQNDGKIRVSGTTKYHRLYIEMVKTS